METITSQAALPPIGDVMHDVGSPITVASLVNNEYDFTNSTAHEASLTGNSVMPWLLGTFMVMSAFIIVG